MKSLLTILSLLVTVGAAFAQTNVIFPRQGTLWKYNQTNDLYTETTGGIGWTLYDYDDSGGSWKEGPALFTFEPDAWDDALVGTALNDPRTPNPLYGGVSSHARYFRKKFTYNDAVAAHTQLRMNRRFDDGAIIWLNGIEIGRVNFTTFDPPTFTLRSECFSCGTGPCTGGGDANCEQVSLFPADALVQGDNIIAIAIHQTGGNSSDLVFGTSLEVILPKAPTIVSNSEPADRTVLQNRSTTLRVYAEAAPAPTYQWFYSATGEAGSFTPILDATNSSHTIPSMQSADEGYYYVTAANVISSVDSRIAHVVYTEDNTAPLMLSVSGSGKFDNVIVVFDEAMDPVTIGDNFNWAVIGPEGALTLLDPVAATLSADGKVATVAFASGVFLQENTVYTVSVSGVADSTGINFITDTNLSFTSYVSACSALLFEAFDTPTTNSANAVSTLTTHTNFPANPMTVARIVGWDTRHGYPDNSHEQFGGRVRGLFVPPISGQWVFYLASDDAGQLFLNPNGPDSAGKTLVAEETGCCNNFTTPPSPRTSTPQNLTAGQAYYMEALYKEGTGGDWLKVAARLAGDGVPAGGNSDNAGLSPNALAASAGPAGILSFVTIGTQPASQSVIAGRRATFSVQLSPDVPGCFQWKRDDGAGAVDIPGAVGQHYNLNATLADNGAKFSVAISLLGGSSLMSTEATLTVENDVTAPTVTGITTDVARTNITLTYSEPMDPTSTTATGNYSIAGTTIQSATLANPTTVNLAVNPALNACQTYNLAISGVRDANTVLISPTNIAFTGRILLLDWDAATIWRYHDDGTEPTGAWTERTYDDSTSAWASGAAAFAFEPGTWVAETPLRTTISNVTRTATAYFRAHFNLNTDPSTVTDLQIRQIVDDGAVYYINGVEVYRSRINAGAVTHSTFANAGGPEPANGTHTTEGPFDALRSSLRFGDNVLAVSLHATSGSSDSAFAATLSAGVTQCVAPLLLSISRSGNSVIIDSNGSGTLYKAPTLNGPWTAVGSAFPVTVVADQPQQFFEIRP